MKKEKATFIMPLYAKDKKYINEYFKKSIKSILEQTDTNYQVIIIDDYSPIENYNLALNFINSLNDERFKIIRCNKNRGPGYCRNIGIDYAYKTMSQFILFNDSDDISNPDRLKLVRKAFNNKKVDVIYSSFVAIDENDKEIDYKDLVPSLKCIIDGHKDPVQGDNVFVKYVTQKNYVNLTSTTAVRTSFAYKYKFPNFRVSEDTYAWYMYSVNGNFYYEKNILTKYRVVRKGSSNSRQSVKSFYEEKVKHDCMGFNKAFRLYLKSHKALRNEIVKIKHDFYNCLYNSIEKESSDELKRKLLKKINKYNYYLDINIKKASKYVVQIIVPQTEGKVGGSDTHVLTLSSYQNKDDDYTPIILFTRNPEYLEKIKNKNISYIYCGNCKSKIKQLYLLSDLPRKYNIKIMHSHQYNANYFCSAIKLYNKRWRHIPCVMTCHGWIENNIVDKYYTFWDFFTYLFATALICVSTKDINRLNKTIYKNKKKFYIPNGVEVDYKEIDKKTILKKYKLPLNKKIVAYVGRLAPEKRIDLIIESARINCSKNDDLIYIICGSGDEESNIKSLINKYKLNDRVFMLGYIANIKEIYSIVDVLVLSSDTEGTPRAVLEAMSNKVCVVSTNVGGLKEIITNNKNGILVEKGNYEELSEKILYLLNNDKLRIKFANEGYKKVNKEFNIIKMKEEIKKVYNKIK